MIIRRYQCNQPSIVDMRSLIEIIKYPFYEPLLRKTKSLVEMLNPLNPVSVLHPDATLGPLTVNL